MLSHQVLATLRCPEDRSELSLVAGALVDRINAAIRAGTLMSKSGKRVDEVIDGALVRADGKQLYPIVEGIPMLLADDAIELESNSLE